MDKHEYKNGDIVQLKDRKPEDGSFEGLIVDENNNVVGKIVDGKVIWDKHDVIMDGTIICGEE